MDITAKLGILLSVRNIYIYNIYVDGETDSNTKKKKRKENENRLKLRQFLQRLSDIKNAGSKQIFIS